MFIWTVAFGGGIGRGVLTWKYLWSSEERAELEVR